ncbi:MAG: hypothetical protein WC455_28700 [Dehalococcoidia bacterium]|jgi:hypothetical protein
MNTSEMNTSDVLLRLAVFRCNESCECLDEAISQLHESIDRLEKARCGLAVVRAEIG